MLKMIKMTNRSLKKIKPRKQVMFNRKNLQAFNQKNHLGLKDKEQFQIKTMFLALCRNLKAARQQLRDKEKKIDIGMICLNRKVRLQITSK